jgi:futalosine hydrolase
MDHARADTSGLSSFIGDDRNAVQTSWADRPICSEHANIDLVRGTPTDTVLGMSVLLAYAAPREGESVIGRHDPVLQLGVGKVATAIRLTQALAERRPDAVFSFGIAGAYPSRHIRPGLTGLRLLDVCVVTHEWLVDEGIEQPDGFRDLAEIGLGEIGPWTADAGLSDRLVELLGCPRVIGATVSTVSGVDRLSHAYAQRTGAQVETMEGAVVAAVCARFGVPFAEVRVISNFTGDRDRSGWDLEASLARLAEVMDRVLASGVLA